MKPQKLPLDPFTEGDEWEGIPAILIRVNDAPPDAPLALVTMRFKRTGAVPSEIVQLTSATPGQITITSAASWEFTIPPQILTGLKHGKWDWRIRCQDTTATGAPKTWLADTIEVLETI